MKLYVGEDHTLAQDKEEALRIAVDMLRTDPSMEKVVLHIPDKGVYGWVQYCTGVNDGRRYLVCYRKGSNVGRTILLPDFKLGWGERWSKPRRTSQKHRF